MSDGREESDVLALGLKELILDFCIVCSEQDIPILNQLSELRVTLTLATELAEGYWDWGCLFPFRCPHSVVPTNLFPIAWWFEQTPRFGGKGDPGRKCLGWENWESNALGISLSHSTSGPIVNGKDSVAHIVVAASTVFNTPSKVASLLHFNQV